MTPTVLVSIPHGAAAGNVLRTGLVRRLLDTPEAPDVVPASPLVRRAEATAAGTIRWIRAKRLLASTFAPSIVRPRTRYALMDRWVTHPQAELLFDRYRPSLLVTSNPGLILSEVPLLRTAVRRGVRSMAIDPSWDNFTNKLLPVRRVDRLIVWNDLMKQQAIDLHGYRLDEIRVAGTPQWDLYFRPGHVVTREDFFRRIGADPQRKLVTLTTTPRELYPHHDHVVRVMAEAIRAGRWPWDAQILVRLHPRDDRSAYAAFESMPHVLIEKPFRSTVRAGDGLDIVGAIGAPLLPIHTLCEHHTARRSARCGDARPPDR